MRIRSDQAQKVAWIGGGFGAWDLRILLCVKRKVSMSITLYSPTFIERMHSGHGVGLS